MFFTLEPHVLSGNDVLSVKGMKKAFGSEALFENLDMEIFRGEHVALIGDNGTGKTTLLKIINGLLPADAGSVKLGSLVTIGYYDQEQQLLTESNTLFEEIREAYPAMTDTLIRNTLAAFLFTGDDVFKLVSDLSGGERGRLSLAKLILSPCNFLILDEPTNHLDMASREILEDAISRYSGTVLVVSHDRYFMNRIAHRILELDNRRLTEYIGNYDDYLEKKSSLTAAANESSSISAAARLSESALDRRQRKEEQAVKRRLERELEKTEQEIEACETRQQEIDRAMQDPAIASNASRLLELSLEHESLQKKLDGLYVRWEELSE